MISKTSTPEGVRLESQRNNSIALPSPPHIVRRKVAQAKDILEFLGS